MSPAPPCSAARPSAGCSPRTPASVHCSVGSTRASPASQSAVQSREVSACAPSARGPSLPHPPPARRRAPPCARSPSLISQQMPEREECSRNGDTKAQRERMTCPRNSAQEGGEQGHLPSCSRRPQSTHSIPPHTSLLGPQSGAQRLSHFTPSSQVQGQRLGTQGGTVGSAGCRTGGRTVRFHTIVPRKRRVGFLPAFFPSNAEGPATESCRLHFRTAPS